MAQVLVKHWKIALLWVASLVLVSAAVASAQQGLRNPPTMSAMPEIISGSDVGFRIDKTVDGIPQGAVVVRVGGKWVEVAPNRR